MSEVLVNYVVDANSAQLLALSLEDMALCQAWYASCMDVPEIRRSHEGLPARVAQWTSDKVNPGGTTLGARQQPVLRHVVERAISVGPAGLERDELDFLFFTYELIQRTKHRNQFQRPLDLIAPHVRAIRQLRDRLEPVRGLPSVLREVGVATEASILSAPRRVIGAFGGLPLDFQGPMLRHRGSLKVVGDIPDGSAVVVEGGGCYVSGYVLGKLLVRGHVEVRENVSELLISQQGNIRARSIVNKATVIAKLGRIRVGAVEDPELVYAGTQLRIDETARQGRYVSPRIRVDGVLSGAACHVTAYLQAGTLAPTNHQPLDIVLRSELGCEDYGELLPKEAHVLQRTASKFRNRIAYLQQLMGVQQEEAEHYASTALLYICSGKDSQKELQQADSLKRRRAFLVRLLTGLHLLTASLSERLRACQEQGVSDNSSSVSAERSVQSVLNEVSTELAQLKIEGDIPRELDQEWGTLMELHASSSKNVSEGVLSQAILRFHEARKGWREELSSLDKQVKALQDHLTKDATRKRLVDRAQADGTSQTALAQLIRAAREKGVDDPIMQRVATPFMKRMLTLLQKRNQWVERYRKEAGEQRAKLAEIRKRLLNEFSVDLASQIYDPQVVGCFEAGVRLFLGGEQDFDVMLEQGSALITPDSQGESWTYGVQDGEIVRIEAE